MIGVWYKTLDGFIADIENRPLAVTEFDEKLWLAVVEKVTVDKYETMVFRFKNGTEITVRYDLKAHRDKFKRE